MFKLQIITVLGGNWMFFQPPIIYPQTYLMYMMATTQVIFRCLCLQDYVKYGRQLR